MSTERDATQTGGRDAAGIDQLSAFLLRPEVAEFRDALRDDDLEPTELDPASGLDGVLYLVDREAPPPRWLDFLRSVAATPITFEGGRRLSGVLFLRRGEHRLALTFGYGRLLLRLDAVEPDFGLKVAAGLVDPDQLASLDARSLDETSVQVRRQTSRGMRPQAIGFDVGSEMLRALAGRVEDPAVGTRILGSDSVGLTARLTADSLGPRLDALHDAYAAGAYRTRFRHIDRWSRVERGPTRDRLDADLLRVLAHRREMVLAGEDPSAMPGDAGRMPTLEAPEVISFRGSGFRTSREAAGLLHPFPDLDAYLASVPREPQLADLQRNHSLELISDESSEVSRHWHVYEALNWETDLGDDIHVLVAGTWYRIDAGYRARVDDFVGGIPEPALERPDYDPVEWEVDYNRRLADHLPGRVFLDRRTATFEGESGTVEPCDVLTPERQFVHVKPGTSSSQLSHLFGQGLVSARLFLQAPEFRRELRRLMAGTPGLDELVPASKPDPRRYSVVFAVVTDDPGPVGLALPFFARNYLSRVVPDIESMGYAVGAVPVRSRLGARPASAGPLYRVEHARRPAGAP